MANTTNNSCSSSSFPCLPHSPFQRSSPHQLSFSRRLFVIQINGSRLRISTKGCFSITCEVHSGHSTIQILRVCLRWIQVEGLSWLDKSCQFKFINRRPQLKGRFQKQQNALFVVSEDQSQNNELEIPAPVPENNNNIAQDISPASNPSFHLSGSDGKPGFISFYNRPYRRDSEILLLNSERSQNSILWLVGPAVLVASFIFPSLYLRKLLSIIFEDSLLTDFLILFFTEAIFYGGVAVFLFLLDHLRRPIQLDTATKNTDTLPPQLGQKISSVATLVLCLVIPMVTMGLVWPWTGPAASATLAPYLVGIVVQFAFEQYARYRKSPSWSAIPLIFQVYRLHQLNRAAQLVTALSFTVRGAELTSHNMAINSSLGTLLNVLQFLGVICIWSLSSFLMRFIPSASTTM